MRAQTSKDSSKSAYFPADSSILHLVQNSRSVGLLYGQRALILGSTNPLNYIGTSEHTSSKQVPFKRLARTAESFETIFFGSTEEADALLGYIYKAHQKVTGKLEKPAGKHEAGTTYAALDPALMLWTLVCIADSAQTLFELFERKLTVAEREQLWQEYLRFGELFGMPRERAPQTYRDYRKYLDDRLTGDELYLTKAADFMGKAVCFQLPVPLVLKPAMGISNLILRGTLPPQVRELYRLSWSPWHKLLFKVYVSLTRLAIKTLPRSVTHGRNTFFFTVVTRTESKRATRNSALTMPSNPY